ncbi:MAG: cyclase family protein [Megasphaera sp.]|jgi:kynurenine formamidase|nr:cyclase family protein [Megasphaera sp.]MCI1248238.1 cyclase family protein [Megasphaera sp.]
MEFKLWNVLTDLKSHYDWVELSHSLNNDSPYWSGIPDGSVDLSKTCFDWDNDMLECLIQTFTFPGQFGTHIDFPGHFVRGKATSESFGVDQLLFPLCIIDVTAKVAQDIHYAAGIDDIKNWEKQYGPIPDGAFVALRTDWSKKWPDINAMSGLDADGNENFPAWSLDTLKYIYETRNAAANGHETMDTDASAVAAAAGDLICERYVLNQGKIQIEVLNNLDKVAPAGALLIAAWPRIEGATGLPARVFAITPKP